MEPRQNRQTRQTRQHFCRTPPLRLVVAVGLWALAWGAGPAPAAPTESPLYQLCQAAENVADVEPSLERTMRHELQTAVRAELRTLVRGEIQRQLPPGRAGLVPGSARAAEGSAETHGNVAAASEAAAQAQQARRNHDVSAARAKLQEHSSLTGLPGGGVPQRTAR